MVIERGFDAGYSIDDDEIPSRFSHSLEVLSMVGIRLLA